jgi:hypothetical protein
MITRFRFLSVLMCLVFQANQMQLISQPVYIDGKVINSTTSEPVPFAAVKLKNHQLGVFANAGGDFRIITNPEFRTDSLIISCIGYKRNSIAFKDLKVNAVNKIFLDLAIYGLSEIKITSTRKKLSPVQIIGRAIRAIKKNYPETPFNYISYYRDYQKNEGNYVNLNEAIVQTLDNGFDKKSVRNKYRLIDYRKNTDFPRMVIS